MSGSLPPIHWDVLRARCFTPVQGRVLFVLWSRCNENGLCWPSLKSVAEDSGCDERRATTTVESLEASGVITVTRSHGVTNFYSLDPAAILEFVHTHSTYKKVPTELMVVQKRSTHRIDGTPPTELQETTITFDGTPPTELWDEVVPRSSTKKNNQEVVPDLERTQKVTRAKASKPQEPPDLIAMVSLWQSLGLGSVSMTGRTGLRKLIGEHGREWVEHGIRQASSQNIQWPVSWITACIPAWKREQQGAPNATAPPYRNGTEQRGSPTARAPHPLDRYG